MVSWGQGNFNLVKTVRSYVSQNFPNYAWPHVTIQAVGTGIRSHIDITKTFFFQQQQKKLEEEKNELDLYEEGVSKIKELESLFKNLGNLN